MILALVLGLAAGGGAHYTEHAVLPLLALVMTLATMGVEGAVFRSPRALAAPVLVGILMNFGVLGGALLGLNALIIRNDAFANGFIILAAVPPAVAVIPFTDLLKGNSSYTLIGAIGCYLGALVITPLAALAFLGTNVIQPGKLIIILLELILAPLAASRLLLWTGVSRRLEPVKGTVTNWSFFLITYTIVGQPAHGSLSGPAPNVTYTPATNYVGSDSFTYRASDGLANSGLATVNISVTTFTALYSDTFTRTTCRRAWCRRGIREREAVRRGRSYSRWDPRREPPTLGPSRCRCPHRWRCQTCLPAPTSCASTR